MHQLNPFGKLNSPSYQTQAKNLRLDPTAWKPIYKYMEQTPNLNIPTDPKEITAEFINNSFDQATAYMKNRVSYIWKLKTREPSNWSISTWSKYVSNGYVRDKGTDEDKLYVPEEKKKQQETEGYGQQ